ncbi:MAG TPA: cytochrome c peroxidase [Polyangiaceae bacterium]
MTRALSVLLLGLVLSGCEGEAEVRALFLDAEVMQKLERHKLPANAAAPPDVTNRWADDPAAAVLGKKFFFDPRFSGPLLSEDNTGLPGTVGVSGETGRVSCASCHMPENRSYVDTRSARGQLSLASGWTHRKSPALVDAMQSPLLTWDGRATTAFTIVFNVLESPLEFNSSRLFAAQQIARHYRAEYEAIFGPLPALDAFEELEPEDAGCSEFPADPVHEGCPKPGRDDEDVTRVVANMGKAIAAYMRELSCGPSRFDAWLDGDAGALSLEEQSGAELFVGKADCARCHTGPYFSDQKFYNVGAPAGIIPFTGVDNADDPGAAVGLAGVHDDWLGPRGPFSDGDDGRLDQIGDTSGLEGAFRTPGLRCLVGRPAFMHSGEIRSISDVIRMFDEGGAPEGYVGVADIAPLGLTDTERSDLEAFLRALDGPGPDSDLKAPPELP